VKLFAFALCACLALVCMARSDGPAQAAAAPCAGHDSPVGPCYADLADAAESPCDLPPASICRHLGFIAGLCLCGPHRQAAARGSLLGELPHASITAHAAAEPSAGDGHSSLRTILRI